MQKIGKTFISRSEQYQVWDIASIISCDIYTVFIYLLDLRISKQISLFSTIKIKISIRQQKKDSMINNINKK
jgi:hypothetical protein